MNETQKTINKTLATLARQEHKQNQKLGQFISKDDIINLKIALERNEIQSLYER